MRGPLAQNSGSIKAMQAERHSTSSLTSAISHPHHQHHPFTRDLHIAAAGCEFRAQMRPCEFQHDRHRVQDAGRYRAASWKVVRFTNSCHLYPIYPNPIESLSTL
jgi:hypothetical protein